MSEEKEIVVLNPEDFKLDDTPADVVVVSFNAKYMYKGEIAGVHGEQVVMQTPEEFDATSYSSAKACIKAGLEAYALSHRFLNRSNVLWSAKEPFQKHYGVTMQEAARKGDLTVEVFTTNIETMGQFIRLVKKEKSNASAD